MKMPMRLIVLVVLALGLTLAPLAAVFHRTERGQPLKGFRKAWVQA